MRTTITLSVNLKSSPFEVFDQDVDEVIMLINFYIRLENETTGSKKVDKSKAQGVKRVRVNDETASGGWF